MKMKQCILFVFFSLIQMNSLGASNSPDSLFSDEYIESICLNEPKRALALLDEAEQLKKMPPYRLDYLRCLVYHNGMEQYRIALDYANKAYHSDFIQNNPMWKYSLLDMMSNACLLLSDYEACIRYVVEGTKSAREIGNKNGEANMMLMHGEAKRKMGLKAEAETYFLQAIGIQKKVVASTRDWHDIDDLLYSYGTLISAYQEDGKYQAAIGLLPEYERLMDKLKKMPDLPDGVCDMRYASEYAAFACIYAQNGEPETARKYYLKYLETDYASSIEGEPIRIEYLLNSGQYKEALLYIGKEKQRYADNGETISFEYLRYALEYEERALAGLENYKALAETRKQMLAVTDSLNRRDKANAALELSTLYETNEKNEQIRIQADKLYRGRIFQIATLGVLFLSLAVISFIVHSLRTTRRKNRILVQQIDEMLDYQEELHRAKRAMLDSTATLASEELPAGASESEEPPADTSEFERKLFESMDMTIDSEKMFLDPDINREVLVKRFGIPKNSFAQFIQTHTDRNFSGYINNKRIDYSILLLRDEVNYTIQAVSEESGFNNVRTFHRVFRDKFGITPAEYRKNMTRKA